MTTPAFPLRFKDPDTKEMLRIVATQLGVPMNEIAERAIRREVILLGAGIEKQLTEIVAALRSYNPERDIDAYMDDVADGEGLPDPLQATQIPPAVAKTPRASTVSTGKPLQGKQVARRNPKLAGALAAFKQH